MEEILKEKTSCRSRNEDWGGVKTRRYPVSDLVRIDGRGFDHRRIGRTKTELVASSDAVIGISLSELDRLPPTSENTPITCNNKPLR